MKIKAMIVFFMMALVAPQWGFAADQQSLGSEQERAGYAVGLQLGSSLKGLEGTLDVEKFILGVKDAYFDVPSLLSRQEAERYQNEFKIDANNNLTLTRVPQNSDPVPISAPVVGSDAVVKKEQQTDPGVIKLEQYDVKFDTLEQGGYSFYNLYTNGITPGSTDKDIDIICNALSASEFKSKCRALFSARLTFLLKEEITEARFVGARPEVKSDQNLVVVSWKEQLTHKDTKRTEKSLKMSIWLKKQQQKWKVTKAIVD